MLKIWLVLVQFWRCLDFWTHFCSDYRAHASGNLNCCRGSTSLRKDGRPFLNGDGKESFSTTFSHPTRQILIRVPLSVWRSSRSPAQGTVQCCCLLPGTLGAGSGDPPLGAFAVLNSIFVPAVAHWAPSPFPQWHHGFGLLPYAECEGKGCGGLVGGAQRPSSEQVPASSTRKIFSRC